MSILGQVGIVLGVLFVLGLLLSVLFYNPFVKSQREQKLDDAEREAYWKKHDAWEAEVIRQANEKKAV